jgi:hypothetical protein
MIVRRTCAPQVPRSEAVRTASGTGVCLRGFTHCRVADRGDAHRVRHCQQPRPGDPR